MSATAYIESLDEKLSPSLSSSRTPSQVNRSSVTFTPQNTSRSKPQQLPQIPPHMLAPPPYLSLSHLQTKRHAHPPPNGPRPLPAPQIYPPNPPHKLAVLRRDAHLYPSPPGRLSQTHETSHTNRNTSQDLTGEHGLKRWWIHRPTHSPLLYGPGQQGGCGIPWLS